MLNGFEQGTSMNAIDPLREVARGLLADCGITLTQRDGGFHVIVSPAKVWITP
jgi:hypothetical protein